MPAGSVGIVSRSYFKGLCRRAVRSLRDVVVSKGRCCLGIDEGLGKGGRLLATVAREFRGRSLRGSWVLRYNVNTSGSSVGVKSPVSRLEAC